MERKSPEETKKLEYTKDRFAFGGSLHGCFNELRSVPVKRWDLKW
jgi:hypothetical protein